MRSNASRSTVNARGGADVRIEGLCWKPARRRTPVFADLDLDIPAGQRVVVAGPSGAGKSTLLRAIAGLLLTAGQGELSGRVLIDGALVGSEPGRVGLLLQDPTAGLVAETVGRDVAFGLENRRVRRTEIWPRVDAALDATGFPYNAAHPTDALSGGETQRLALAGSLVLDSAVLLLDEPTSMLDAAAATGVREAICLAAARRDATLVIVEHHLEPWIDLADRLIVLSSSGEIVADGRPTDVLVDQRSSLIDKGVWVPTAPLPNLLEIDQSLVSPIIQVGDGEELIRAEGVTVVREPGIRRTKGEPTVAVDDVDCTLRAGRALAVTGASGAGKSTLLSVLCGLIKPTAGTVSSAPGFAPRRGNAPWRWRSRDLAVRLSWTPQVPEVGVVSTTVLDEVLASARAARDADLDAATRRAEGLLDAFGLARHRSSSPYHLSGGEQRRLMVAAALAHGPAGVLLDEPTVGQDRDTWAAVVGALGAARDAGAGVAVATHDEDVVAAIGDERLRLERGRVVA